MTAGHFIFIPSVLLVPVVGVTASMALIGDAPSLADGLGFLLITAAVIINALGAPAPPARRQP